MLESLLTFLFCCLVFAFMQTMKTNRKQQIDNHATAEKNAFMQQLQTGETQFCDHNCQTVNECLPIGTQTEEENAFDHASQTVDQFPLKHRSVQTLENFSQLQIQKYPQKAPAYFRFRYPFLLTPIFFHPNFQRRKISLKSMSKNLLYIILEYAGGHYNFMRCDAKCYKFIKKMEIHALDHLLKLYAANAYYPWHSTYSLSNDGSALISKYAVDLGLQYDSPDFPVFLKYKNRDFGLKYWVGARFYYEALNPGPQLWIRITMKNREVEEIVENALGIKLDKYFLDPERCRVHLSILFCPDTIVLGAGTQKELNFDDLSVLSVSVKEMMAKIKKIQEFYKNQISNYFM